MAKKRKQSEPDPAGRSALTAGPGSDQTPVEQPPAGDRTPEVPPPGRVVRPLGMPVRHGLDGLRQRLGLPASTSVNDIVDAALAELDRLEHMLSRPPYRTVTDTTPQAIGLQL